jgi:hypothetical protein
MAHDMWMTKRYYSNNQEGEFENNIINQPQPARFH